MIRTMSWGPSGNLQTNFDVSECRKKIKRPREIVWVDIYDTNYDDSVAVLADIFEFHPLAIDDALIETHVPKIDDWGDYLYLVTQTIQPDDLPEDGFDTQEVDLFIGKNYIVSYHTNKSQTIDSVWERAQKNPHYFQEGAAHILYQILDETASDFIKSTDNLDIHLNDLEDKLFDSPVPNLLEVIFSLKSIILHLRQSIGPQREVLNKLARGDYPLLGKESILYFRDVYDHYLRLYDIIENLRDLTSNTLEIFLSLVNNHMNGIMKTLTVITTLFMPISFLASFFGMNFFKPEFSLASWTSQPIFYIVLGATILFPLGMLYYFYRKGWMR
jgi:magnesium transporter